MNKNYFIITGLFLLSSQVFAKEFREYPIGDPVQKSKLNIAAVYFAAVPMDHSSMGNSNMKHNPNELMTVTDADIAKEKFAKPGTELIHLEADIHATKDNPNGFAAGEWIPYLTVGYEVTKAGTKEVVLSGDLMPMVANDGPHYGTTVRMPGKGKYSLKYTISPPALARHSDKLTGVAEYWKSFEVQYAFDYEGIAK